MKKFNWPIIISIFTLSLTLESCQVFTGFFKAGIWVGIIIVVVIIAIILWLKGKAGKN